MVRVGIIGAGNVGEALARILVNCGHAVQIANSRGPTSLAAFALATGATPVDIKAIAVDVSVLVIAIPFLRIGDLADAMEQPWPDDLIVVDAGNYYPMRDGLVPGFDQQCPESVWVSARLGVPVVKAFNNIIASQLATEARPKGDVSRIALPVSGGDEKARAAIMALVEDIGYDPFDAGGIDASWRQQPGMPAYCTDPTLAELPHLLRKADLIRGRKNRDSGAKLMARLPATYPAQQLVLAARFTVGLDRLKLRSWLAMLRLVLTMLTLRSSGR